MAVLKAQNSRPGVSWQRRHKIFWINLLGFLELPRFEQYECACLLRANSMLF